jgi:hypothetical protein
MTYEDDFDEFDNILFGDAKNPLNLIETDTAATHGASSMCSGQPVASTPVARQATAGGTAGTNNLTVTCNNFGPQACVMWESAANEPGLTSWSAGTWTVRLSVVTGNSNYTWQAFYVCRASSTGTNLGTVASNTNVGQQLTSPGQFTATATGVSVPSTNTTDRIYIVLVFDVGGTPPQSLTIQSNQIINTPL